MKTRVRVFEQTMYTLFGVDYDVKKDLEALGFNVLDLQYDSYGPVYFIIIEPTDLQLPKWAQYY